MFLQIHRAQRDDPVHVIRRRYTDDIDTVTQLCEHLAPVDEGLHIVEFLVDFDESLRIDVSSRHHADLVVICHRADVEAAASRGTDRRVLQH
jgi:hypothetical protein